MMRPTATMIRSVTDLLPLVQALATTEGVEAILAGFAADRAALDAREGDLQTRENALVEQIDAAQKAEARAQASIKASELSVAKAKQANATLETDRDAISAAVTVQALRADELRRVAQALDQREEALQRRADDLDRRAGSLDAKEADLGVTAAALDERDAKLRAALSS